MTTAIRTIAVIAACALAACASAQRATTGQTPAPSATSLAQANSTAAPESNKQPLPAAQYRAMTDARTNGVIFSVFAQGAPLFSLNGPKQSRDLTKNLLSGNQNIAVRWQKTARSGAGTLTIVQNRSQALFKVTVTAASPKTGQKVGALRTP